MINIQNITVKNFMSVGNQTQAVDFNTQLLTLVLGKNLDLGGEDSGARNGTGKTTIVNALSYALYGMPLTNIRRDNLVNKTNNKNMLCAVTFVKDGTTYKIERGRKPNITKFFINDQNQIATDDAQGENKETQEEINKILGMSHEMFKHIVALNTYTEPFLALTPTKQRELIEQLLGITKLSEKASTLLEQNRQTKQDIQEEKIRMDSIKASNEKIQETIKNLKLKSSVYESSTQSQIVEIENNLRDLDAVDIDVEIETHKKLEQLYQNQDKVKTLNRERNSIINALTKNKKKIQTLTEDIAYAKEQKCPTCQQTLVDDKHENLLTKLQAEEQEVTEYKTELEKALGELDKELESITVSEDLPSTYYDSLEDAYNHKNSVAALRKEIEKLQNQTDPYIEQIAELEITAIQEISYDQMNALENLKAHQDFLYKLLTSKDSFIRKKIIEQNLTFLNQKLTQYLREVGLPHTVEFQNDLTVKIEELGRELDFDNLSRGERNRLILSLSWAFRDVWESLNTNMNLLFIDELIDSGMDTSGVEASIKILKKMSREMGKNVFLISHKDELITRVNSVLHVVKDNGFTSYENNVDIVI
jgi:DNA repair exonuclease SbcCD ATPase subunit